MGAQGLECLLHLLALWVTIFLVSVYMFFRFAPASTLMGATELNETCTQCPEPTVCGQSHK